MFIYWAGRQLYTGREISWSALFLCCFHLTRSAWDIRATIKVKIPAILFYLKVEVFGNSLHDIPVPQDVVVS